MDPSPRPTLVFATRNPGKLVELRALLAELPIDVLSLDEIDRPVPEVDEDGDTFLANAAKKAREVAAATGLPALADDSGLEVDALGGAPGVHSARYAGLGASDDDNNRKLLAALADLPAGPARSARFRSYLVLADPRGPLGPPNPLNNDDILSADGVCEGEILTAPRGTGGFGYDPLFYAPELGQTFAELGVGPKNDLSHRARAMRAMRPQILTYFRLASTRESG